MPHRFELEPFPNIARHHGLQIVGVIETHIQADHVSGARDLAQTVGAPLYFHRQAAVNFVFQPLSDNQVVKVGNRTLKVITTPGHTADSLCLLVDNWFLLTGDTLLVGDVGRVDLSLRPKLSQTQRQAAQLYDSLFSKLLKLPEHTEIYPGHYGASACGKNLDGKPVSTIGREKATNQALQQTDKKRFIAFMCTNLPQPPASYQDIKRRNLGLPDAML